MSANRSVLGTRGLTSATTSAGKTHYFCHPPPTRVFSDSGSRAGSPDPVSYFCSTARRSLPHSVALPCAAAAAPAPLLAGPAGAFALPAGRCRRPLLRRPPAGVPLPAGEHLPEGSSLPRGGEPLLLPPGPARLPKAAAHTRGEEALRRPPGHAPRALQEHGRRVVGPCPQYRR